ncbi:LPXTG cell wall anchor domain-containing protein [Streptomyces sp. YPW6]|uniref:LPXTG cell wall anchor domain-containing protein n=1 Tax=Streptomyces sp. YPW6 TaxID=2840373 RepID=UPI001C0C4E90|nr:LPXTG cell wall anchor domain-containing protein [Streptomyces sp. YPW6]QWQ40336.1 LPXTG cell wall anchor domain-containing protein [Streptomyces sp. YPW6]
MKLRRAMAVAAATAALAPVTLLSATAAIADSETAEPVSVSAETTAPVQETSAPAPEGTETSSAAVETTGPGAAAPTVSATPSQAASTQPAPAKTTTDPTPSATPTSLEDICDGEQEPLLDESLSTSLSGLPSKVVAGSGFQAFELNVVNKGDKAYQRVDLGVFAAQFDADTWEETTGHLTLQFKNPDTGQWQDISLDADDDEAGYLGYTDVRAKETLSIDMRLSVDKKAPAGLGFAITIGIYADDQGNCVFAGDQSFYEFEILAVGTEPGESNEAEPQEGGKKPIPVKPAGNTEINPEGVLAETGADSQLPVIATAGGLAILVGTGVVFALKRRRPTTTA